MPNAIIKDKLYLGDVQDAQHLPDYHIDFDRVISVGDNITQPSTDDHFPMPDGGWEFDPEEHYPVFKEAVNTLRSALVEGERVFIHCRAGQSRSAAVCIASIATLDGTSYEEAYEEVREGRPIINPTTELEECAKKYITTYEIHHDR